LDIKVEKKNTRAKVISSFKKANRRENPMICEISIHLKDKTARKRSD
jgi:hypothetical protein